MSLKELKEKASTDLCESMVAFEEVWVDHQKAEERPKYVIRIFEQWIEKAYIQAIRDAMGSLPEEEVHTTSCKAWHARTCTCHMPGFNDCRKESLVALEKLLPKEQPL